MPTITAIAATPRATTTSTGDADAPIAPAPAPAAPPQPSIKDKFVARAKTELLAEASKEHSVVDLSKTVSTDGVSFTAAGKLTEKVALAKGDALVEGDSRRKAGAEAGQVWTRLGVGLDASAAAGVAIGSGTAASFGFAAGARLSAVVAADKSLTMSNVTGTLREAGELAAVSLDPLRLLADNHPPGTELMIQGNASASAGVGVGATAASRFATVNAGVSAALSKGAQYTKNVKVLGDGRVYVQISKVKSTAGSVSAGLDVRPEAGGSGLLGRAGNAAEKEVRLTASLGAGLSKDEGLKVSGVFDLHTAEGRAAYTEVMNANPLTLETSPHAAQALLDRMAQGAAYVDTTKTSSASATIQLGRAQLLAFSSAKRTTEGLLLESAQDPTEPVSRTRLSETEYTRNVSGALPRLANGEERTVALRLGSVQKGGDEQRAALLQLHLKDAKVTRSDQERLGNFAAAFGQTLPAATKEKEKGTLGVAVALTDDNLKALAGKSEDELRLAFSDAMAKVHGREVPWRDESMGKKNPNYAFPPPVRSVKDEFVEGATGFGSLDLSDDRNERGQRIRDYRDTTGRDLEDDVGGYLAMTTFAQALTDAKSKSVTEWGPTLKTLGKLPSGDLRVAMVALKESTGASLVSMNIDANGASLAASGAAAPRSIADYVGPVLTPAEVH